MPPADAAIATDTECVQHEILLQFEHSTSITVMLAGLTCGMSFLCAMSLMRVSGTCCVNASPKDGSFVCTLRATSVTRPCLSSEMAYSRDLWTQVHAVCCVACCPATLQAANSSLTCTWPDSAFSFDWLSSGLWSCWLVTFCS